MMTFDKEPDGMYNSQIKGYLNNQTMNMSIDTVRGSEIFQRVVIKANNYNR